MERKEYKAKANKQLEQSKQELLQIQLRNIAVNRSLRLDTNIGKIVIFHNRKPSSYLITLDGHEIETLATIEELIASIEQYVL